MYAAEYERLGAGVVNRIARPPKDTWNDRRRRPWPETLVEHVINQHCNGRPIELARKLERMTGKPVLRQSITGWRTRGQFPPELIPAIHLLTGIPLAELIVRNRPRF